MSSIAASAPRPPCVPRPPDPARFLVAEFNAEGTVKPILTVE